MTAAETVVELLHRPPCGDAWPAELRKAAATARIWADTFAECSAIERFSFDLLCDPVR
jgi:hypothetical protein